MNRFKDACLKTLNEAIKRESEDAEAFKNSLTEKSPEDFDVEPMPPIDDVDDGPMGIEEAQKWIRVIGKFADFLNGTESTSVHAKINELDVEGSIWEGFSEKERKKIVSVATELRNLQEILKSQITSAHNRHKAIKEKNNKLKK